MKFYLSTAFLCLQKVEWSGEGQRIVCDNCIRIRGCRLQKLQNKGNNMAIFVTLQTFSQSDVL